MPQPVTLYRAETPGTHAARCTRDMSRVHPDHGRPGYPYIIDGQRYFTRRDLLLIGQDVYQMNLSGKPQSIHLLRCHP